MKQLKYLTDFTGVTSKNQPTLDVLLSLIQLNKFYESLGRHDVAISYLWQLLELYKKANNQLEKAYTLLYIVTYYEKKNFYGDANFDMSKKEAPTEYKAAATPDELIAMLLRDAQKFLAQAKAWEKAIEVAKKRDQFHTEWLPDNNALAQIHADLSCYYRDYEKKVMLQRLDNQYVALHFSNHPYFPKFLPKVLIMMNDGDNIGGNKVNQLILSSFPKVTFSSNEPMDKDMDMETETPVVYTKSNLIPQPNYPEYMKHNPKIKAISRKYYQKYEVNSFKRLLFTKRKDDSEIMRIVHYTSEDRLPGILPCQAVKPTNIVVSDLRPAAYAEHLVSEGLRDLGCHLEYLDSVRNTDQQAYDTHFTKPFNSAVFASLQSSVSGGFDKYLVKPADLYTEEDRAKLKDLSIKLLNILIECLSLYRKHPPNVPTNKFDAKKLCREYFDLFQTLNLAIDDIFGTGAENWTVHVHELSKGQLEFVNPGQLDNQSVESFDIYSTNFSDSTLPSSR
ncbi:hypothetical protein Ciccas_012281 [Cichlidogyrus casuarinus]|uniref:DOCKER domain-containing protein n=1 Tax=Cichlidogyrus casuarinus TaxID=1844966 RepID=A0ABD2PNV0_9PLAT